MVALFVVMTIVVCIAADSVVQWRRAKGEKEAKLLADKLVAPDFAKVAAPANVFLDEGHTWVQVEASGRADIGVDGFAQKLIGRVDSVELPAVGREVQRGDVLFAIHQGRRRAAFASPLDGVVSAVDKELAWHPETLAEGEYADTWVCTLRPQHLAQDLKRLHIAEEAQDWMRGEVERVRDFFAARPLEGAELSRMFETDGRLSGGLLEHVDDGTWKQFTEEFLRPQHSTSAAATTLH